MNSETNRTAQTNEQMICVPAHVEPNLPTQYFGNDVTQFLLALAFLTRSAALFIQVVRQQKGHK